jgi:hypothetical protein
MKYTMTYSRTFTTTFEAEHTEHADKRARDWVKNFPSGEVTVLSVYADDYRAPAVEEPKPSKFDETIDGMRAKINSMLPHTGPGAA